MDFIRPDFLLLRVSCVTLVCAPGQEQCLANSSFSYFAGLNSFNWVLFSIKSNLSLGRWVAMTCLDVNGYDNSVLTMKFYNLPLDVGFSSVIVRRFTRVT